MLFLAQMFTFLKKHVEVKKKAKDDKTSTSHASKDTKAKDHKK